MRGDRVIASYDSFHPQFNRARPLIGCLDFLAGEGFITSDELQDLLVFLPDGTPRPSDMASSRS